MQCWITDIEPSARFPLYTKANAGEVLPDPVSPLFDLDATFIVDGQVPPLDAWPRHGAVVTVDGSSGTITVIDLPEG